jgi:Ca-activated chloride channel family protein
MVKLRNVITLAVVGVLLLGTGWVWSLNHDNHSATPRDQGVVASKVPDSVDASGTLATRGGTENTVTLPEAPPPPRTPADGTYKRDIITNGSMQIVVAEPAQAADRLVSAATGAGGRVDSRSEQSASSSGAGSPTVNLVLRIPADKLDGVLAEANKLGTVDSMSISHTDVTSQRVDLDARIAALQTSVNRLMELMGRAGNVADLLAAESALTQRQADLDSLRAQRTVLGDEISYATINVTVSAKPPATVTHGGFLGALQHGWQSLLSAVQSVVLTVGFLIPWIPVVAVLAFVLILVVRRRSSRRASRAAASSELDDEAAVAD